MPLRTDPKTFAQWLRYIVVAAIALFRRLERVAICTGPAEAKNATELKYKQRLASVPVSVEFAIRHTIA